MTKITPVRIAELRDCHNPVFDELLDVLEELDAETAGAAGAATERARIVAWLRAPCSNPDKIADARWEVETWKREALADYIERGAHNR